METREAIKNQFDELGFDLEDAVLDKCVEMCILHNVDEESFVETWMAFSITNLNGDPPTTETLQTMERKEFGKQGNSTTNIRQVTTTPLPVYNKTPTSNKKNPRENGHDTTPKNSKNEGLLSKKLSTSAPLSTFSPASFSPIIESPSAKYSARTNAGMVMCELSERPVGDWKAKERTPLTVAPYRDELTTRCRLMMEPLKKKVAVHNDVISRISSFLIENNNLPAPVFSNTFRSDKEVVFVGRVCSSSKSRLTPTTVLLEGSPDIGGTKTVPLHLQNMPHFALFPGQVIAVSGTNPTGEKIIASKIFSAAPLPMHPQIPRFSACVEIVVAAGPFTQSDSLAYEPLEDLMTYVKSHKPHLLILLGPVVDLRQAQLNTGSFAETYQQLFDKIINGIADQLKGSWTQVVVVASAHDGTCLPVFPTPPPLHHSSSPVRLVSDPSLLNVNGLLLSVTSTDSLMHLSKEEISGGPSAMDRLGRLAAHLIHQQSIYPLCPPCEDLVVDTDLWDTFSCLPVTPHVLIVPSNLRFFLKQIEGCLVINPEHLTKGASGGTFVRLQVEPPTEEAWSVSTHISAQILKV